MEKLRFTELGLSADILKAVDKMGFEEASPIQSAVIPTIMAGRDVVGQSSTGSGKTVAFAIPAIEKVDPKIRAVQVLILCPTRELAVQVAEETGKIALFKRGVMGVPIYGGQSYERQFRALDAGAQVVIGTPGRVMDHMERGSMKLDKLKIVILDETDRMLDMGFRDDIEHILKSVPATRQLLFFSATIPRAIQDLIGRYSKDPAWIKIESVAQNAPQVEQTYFEVDRRSKIEALTRLIDVNDFRYGIIFCSTKIMVDDLDEHLHSRGYMTDRLHGDISQAQRDRVMDKFRRRGFEFLVATDVAARGLDVDDLEVVFNFDLPNDAEDYTHRIGRTGRAGRKGQAFTFVSGQEIYKLQSMVRWAKLDIRRGKHSVARRGGRGAHERVLRKGPRDARREEVQAARPDDRPFARSGLREHGHLFGADQHVARRGRWRSGRWWFCRCPGGTGKTCGWRSECGQCARETGTGGDRADGTRNGSGDEGGEGRARLGEAGGLCEAEAGVGSGASETEGSGVNRNAGCRPGGGGERGARGLGRRRPRRLRPRKSKYERPARTGREPGMKTIFLNVGRKQLVTPADIVGKIAGVTRLPANAVGALDIHQRHTLVDVAAAEAEFIVKKLAGIMLKGVALAPAMAGPDNDIKET
jgi:ATP-dependent RNA helicase DeaD